MSLKPIDHPDATSDGLDLGGGSTLRNEAHGMKHYAAQRKPGGAASQLVPDATGAMRVYAAHGEKPPTDRRRTALLVGGLVAVAVVLGAGVTVGVASCSSQVADEQQATGSVQVTIPSGYGVGDIAQILRDNGVISSTTSFVQSVSQEGAESKLQAGTYTFERGESYEDIVAALVEGPAATGVTLTVPEGLTVSAVAQRVQDVLGISSEDFLAQAKASNYVGEFTFLNGAYNDSLEGFLFPKTYTFQPDCTADDVIRTMLNQFVTETSGIDWSSSGLSEFQTVVVASLIERETAVSSERPLVASVIYNRLAADMPLQIDAVVAYVLNKSDALTYDDLDNVAQNNPDFDVYYSTGLPGGPICSPSLESLQAAANPEQTGYYYYVASSNLDGTHVFCETEDQFVEARDAYYAAVGTQG